MTSVALVVQLPSVRGGPAVYEPGTIQSLPPCDALCTCVYVGAPWGAARAPGVVRGSGKNDGHSPCGNPGCLPMRYHVCGGAHPAQSAE